MPCDIKLQITSYNQDKEIEEKQLKTIKKGVGEDLPLLFSDVAEYIMRLPKNERTLLAAKLRQAKILKLTNTDVKNHIFISNTTIDALKLKYPDLNDLFPNLVIKPTDNYIIINCALMELNGSSYFGRTINSDGKEIFFINGFYGAQHFFNYLDIKNKISDFLEDTSSDIYTKYKEDLEKLTTKFEVSAKELFLNYLNNLAEYAPYKDGNSVIIPKKILNAILSEIKNVYNVDNDKTDLHLLLETILEPSKNTYEMLFSPKKLFNTLFLNFQNQTLSDTSVKLWDKLFYNESTTVTFLDDKIILNKIRYIEPEETEEIEETEETKSKLIKNETTLVIDGDNIATIPEEDLSDLLQTIFKGDPKLIRARIKYLKPGTTKIKEGKVKEVSLKTAEIEEMWKQIKEFSSDKLAAFKTSLKKDPEKVQSLLKEHLKKGYTDSEGILHTDLKFKIVDTATGSKKLKISYDKKEAPKEVSTSGDITLYFPWNTIGGIYNFAYDTKYLFSPVKKAEAPELDSDGMYKGAYIYEYYDAKSKTTHFAISRHIISPKSYMLVLPSFEAAKHKIDMWSETLIIKEWGLYSLKLHKSTPRSTYIESGNVTDGLIITTLNLTLPNIPINKFPSIFRNAFNSTLPKFYELFSNTDTITLLNTPEKASAFLFKFYEALKVSEKENLLENNIVDIEEVINNNLKKAQEIIKEINEAEPISYYVDRIYNSKSKGNLAILSLLKNNGNNVLVEGKYADSTPANTPSIANMENAIKYFNSTFGLSIKTMTLQELMDFDREKKLGLQNRFLAGGIRAFIYEGQIYINSSNADVSDLFHEMAHIFFGMIKVKYPKAYESLMNKYIESKEFIKNFRYIDDTYKNFSRQDLIEETVVDIIANKMFNNQSLSTEFKEEEFIKDFDFILNKLPNLMRKELDNGLGFLSFMKTMLKDTKNISELKRNMKISQLFYSLKNDGKIKEMCE